MAGGSLASASWRLKLRKATKERLYEYTLSGLSNVYLTGITVYTCPVCEAEGPVIPKIDQLHDSIAAALIKKPGKLGSDCGADSF